MGNDKIEQYRGNGQPNKGMFGEQPHANPGQLAGLGLRQPLSAADVEVDDSGRLLLSDGRILSCAALPDRYPEEPLYCEELGGGQLAFEDDGEILHAEVRADGALRTWQAYNRVGDLPGVETLQHEGGPRHTLRRTKVGNYSNGRMSGWQVQHKLDDGGWAVGPGELPERD